jgi:Cu(I)/Ag(I) efflux system membrane fusion protein
VAETIELTPDQVSRAGIQVTDISRRVVATDVHTTGQIELDRRRVADLVARVDGWIQELRAFPQDAVSAGDTLALLYSPTFLAAETELLQSTRRVERARTSEDSAELATARSILSAGRQKLELLGAEPTLIDRVLEEGVPRPLLPVPAPLSGTVLRSDARRGASVSPGDLLFQVGDLSTVWAEIDIYETDLGRIHRGDPVALSVKAYPGEVFSGRLRRVGQEFDPETRTVKATAVIANGGGRLKAGMFADAVVRPADQGREVVAVPDSAVQLMEGGPVVFVRLGPGRFRARSIQTGARAGGWVEVVSGLQESDAVVISGTYFLKSELLKESFAEEEE